MALSFLTGFSPVGTSRRPDAAPAPAKQPAVSARNEQFTDRRSAPAVQVRLSPEALAVLNGAPPPQAAQEVAPAGAAAFEPLAFCGTNAPEAESVAAEAPQRPLRPGSRLDIKL